MFSSLWRKITKILLTCAAWGALLYFFITYEDYNQVLSHFQEASLWQYIALCFVVLLFPLNQFFEACKWRSLSAAFESITLMQAQKEVYFGATGAFLTPARLGEYPTRMLLRSYSSTRYIIGVCLGFIGACITNTLTAILGLCSLPFLINDLPISRHLVLFITLLLVNLCLLVLIFYPTLAKRLARSKRISETHREALQHVAATGHKQTLPVAFWTFARYLVFSLQLYLALYFVGIPLSLTQALLTIPTYYLLVTFTPNFAIADPAIRGSWAVVVFTQFAACTTDSVSTIIATTLIWFVNTILPMLIGSFLSAKDNNTASK